MPQELTDPVLVGERIRRIRRRRGLSQQVAADLAGQWWPDEDPVHADASARMSEVRAVLIDSDIGIGAEGPVLPLISWKPNTNCFSSIPSGAGCLLPPSVWSGSLGRRTLH